MRVIRKLTGILVDNAVKYADEGGEMRPKAEIEDGFYINLTER